MINNMENYSDRTKFDIVKEFFKQGKADKIHILADFDNTLTKTFVNGKIVPSITSILRDGNHLTPDYALKANELYNKYHRDELDISLSKEERKRLMEEWWMSHFDLLIKSGLRKKDIEEAVSSDLIQFREGFSEFIGLLKEHNIPLVILSSSGLGEESISLKFKKEEKMYDNLHIISNRYEWDKEGKAVSVIRPIIHMANKDQTFVRNFPIVLEAVKGRKNVILMGDSLDDIGMIEGFDYDNLIKIAFFNDKKEELLSAFKENYDVVISDSSMDFINNLLKEII